MGPENKPNLQRAPEAATADLSSADLSTADLGTTDFRKQFENERNSQAVHEEVAKLEPVSRVSRGPVTLASEAAVEEAGRMPGLPKVAPGAGDTDPGLHPVNRGPVSSFQSLAA